jgi:hypothetical protein
MSVAPGTMAGMTTSTGIWVPLLGPYDLREDDTLALDIEHAAGPPADPGRIARRVARVPSADHDGRHYAALCRALGARDAPRSGAGGGDAGG